MKISDKLLIVVSKNLVGKFMVDYGKLFIEESANNSKPRFGSLSTRLYSSVDAAAYAARTSPSAKCLKKKLNQASL